MILAFKIGFLTVDWVDVLDILLVTLLLAQVYKLIRGSMAIRVFFGFLSLYLIYLIVRAFEMELLSSILGQFMGVGVLALIILFQQEIRKFLVMLGKTTNIQEGQFMKNVRSILHYSEERKFDISPIVEAVKSLSASSMGALIVLSKNSELKFYAESGDRLDAVISKRLLISIFNKYSPMHDGAVIIYNDKLVAARCILPVTERDDLPANYGLRHRAAIGMTEITDTLVIVVSEETGEIATAQNGEITQNISAQELRIIINNYLTEDEVKRREGLGRIFKKDVVEAG
jgi:diadenylate cyclase